MITIIVGAIIVLILIVIFGVIVYIDNKRDEKFEEDIKKIQRGDRGFFDD